MEDSSAVPGVLIRLRVFSSLVAERVCTTDAIAFGGGGAFCIGGGELIAIPYTSLCRFVVPAFTIR